MTANHWMQRVTGTAVPRELQELRSAARDLSQQAGHVPGRTRLIFQTVADVALIGTAVLGTSLAAVHLWKGLSRKHPEPHPARLPEPAGAGRSPPRHRSPHPPAYDAGENDHPGRRRPTHATPHHGRG